MNGNETLENALKSSPSGTLKCFRGTGTGVEKDIFTSLENRRNLKSRIDHAIKCGCYIEVIALRIQTMDYWLRLYFVNRSTNGERKREFGALLDQCKGLGLSNDLYLKIKSFNEKRIKAIHGFLVGAIIYQDLEEVALNSSDVLYELMVFVLDNCGTVITALEGTYEVGDAIYDIPSFKLYGKI